MSDYNYKVITLGDGAVGKTATITRFVNNFFKPDYEPTIGVQFLVHTLEIDDLRIKLQIWDFMGQERFRFLLPFYSKGAKGAVLLFDLTRAATVDTLSDWIDITREGAGDIPILLVGNKCDLEELREVPTDYAIELAKKSNCLGYLETSAKTGENIREAFKALTIAIQKRD